jgi:mono/diheme cytochrome c family protein
MRGQSRLGPAAMLVTLVLGSGGLVLGVPTASRAAHPPTSHSRSLAARGGLFLEATETQGSDTMEVGGEVFCQRCRTCHGDRGQGLTPEFRQIFPPELQDCWATGCHSQTGFEGGFALPREVPPVIGESSRARFTSASALDDYIRAQMPYQAPGKLGSDERNRVVTFLAWENHLPPEGPDQETTTPSPPPTATVERKPALLDSADTNGARAATDASHPGGAPLVLGLVLVGSAAALILLGLVRRARSSRP